MHLNFGNFTKLLYLDAYFLNPYIRYEPQNDHHHLEFLILFLLMYHLDIGFVY